VNRRSPAALPLVGPPVDATAGDPRAPRHERTAVVVCHGMGQQVRFETIDTVARLIGVAAEARLEEDAGLIVTRVVDLEGVKTARAELAIPSSSGRFHEVHVYETYWAPLTEGAVRFRDVVAFLLRSAWNGFRGVGFSRLFERFIFGRVSTFVIPWVTWVELAIGSLVAFALLVLTLGVSWGVGQYVVARGDDSAFWRGVLVDWTGDILLFLTPLAITCAVLWAASALLRRARANCLHGRDQKAREVFKRQIRNLEIDGGPSWRNGLIWTLLFVTCAGLLIADVLGGLHLLVRLGHLSPASLPDVGWPPHWTESPVARLMIWALALTLAFVVRWFVVEFVGDVAAYVSAPWLDRFFRLRDEIKKVCADVTRAVYNCNEYDRIVLVGHSLGSVVAYDVLNTLVNEELLGKTPDVIRRTAALLTFGSPLDKTAFVFRMQNVAKQYVREALASAVQPLIVSYDYRPPLWFNIWSPSDIISGSLEFYDAAEDGPRGPDDRRIRNLVDRQADLPLIAHVQYWNNPLLGICLFEALNAPVETYEAV
jgi:hypothetical protein